MKCEVISTLFNKKRRQVILRQIEVFLIMRNHKKSVDYFLQIATAMKKILAITFLLTSTDVFAQDCQFVFLNYNQNGASSPIKSLLRQRLLTGRRGPVLTAPDYAPSPSQSQAPVKKLKGSEVNRYLKAFQRKFNFQLPHEYSLDWFKVNSNITDLTREVDPSGSTRYSFRIPSRGGHKLIFSKVAGIYLSALREAIINQSENRDSKLAYFATDSAPRLPPQSKQTELMISLRDLEKNVKNYMPAYSESVEEYYHRKQFRPEEHREHQVMSGSHADALDAVVRVGGIDVLSSMIGRENLFGLYFDVLADLKARAAGERFESPRLGIFSEQQMQEFAKDPDLNKIVRELSVSEYHQPNVDIVIALGLSYLRSDLSPINHKALRDYVNGKESAKYFLPDTIFDSLHSIGYAPSDFVSIMERVFWNEQAYFNHGRLIISNLW